jgi:hypothetical protein
MKTLLRIIFGLLVTVVLLSFCDSWIFSNSEFDWLENLNGHIDHDSEDFDEDQGNLLKGTDNKTVNQ